MSISSSIALRVIKTGPQEALSPIETLRVLLKNGWRLINQSGYAFYIPLGDIDMFDWIGDKIDTATLMNILEEKEQNHELIGVRITWKHTDIGGELLLWNSKEASKKNIKTPMSFSLDLNRKVLDHNITDVNWYLTKLLPAFNQDGKLVEYFTYEEHL